MNRKSVFRIAKKKTPEVQLSIKDRMMRHEIVNYCLSGNKNIGVELGVAQGIYSKRMVDSGKFRLFFGVDAYGDTHDVKEYKEALKYVGIEANYHLIRAEFQEALDVFDDEYFDFIYIDGFAHTGEEGGQALIDWYAKLKMGGILAGDDYHEDWPLVKWAVNDFVTKLGCELFVTGGKEDVRYSRYPSWYLHKNNNVVVEPDELLLRISNSEKVRINRKRMKRKKHGLRRFIKYFFKKQK